MTEEALLEEDLLQKLEYEGSLVCTGTDRELVSQYGR